MKKNLTLGALIGAAAITVAGEKPTDWFRDAGYGLFVHWGCYSVPARGEWYLNSSQMDPAEYARYADQFKAERFDAKDWAAKAKRWGMKYVVFTTRHHDGFAMWDSQVNPFNAKACGPKRDILGELVPALKAEGLKVGFYYSPANWSRRDYPGYRVKGWPKGVAWAEADRRSFVDYYKAEFAELLAKYGAPDLVWWDGCIPQGLEGEALLQDLKKKHPATLLTDRMGRPFDIRCCECEINPPKEKGVLWESCMTLNQSWGFCRDDAAWKSPKEVIDMLLTCRADGGNLLLNVGPKSDGTIPEASVKILDEVGRFLAREGVGDALAVYPDAIVDRGNPLGLRRVFDKAERGETLRVAVIGGSITGGAHAGGREREWGSVFAAGWRELFPKAKVEFLNAGVGATGSLIGAFRYSHDVSPFKPDVLGVEFSVNDPDNDEARQTMEGVLRHARREGTAVVLLGMTNKGGANAQAAHLKAARKYGAPFVSYRDGVMKKIKAGTWKWEDVGADGVHPNRRGHALAGELMNLFVRDELRRYNVERRAKPPLPQPVITEAFEQGSFTPFAELPLVENCGFVPYQEGQRSWGRGLLSTNAGDRVVFTFTGSTAAFLYRHGDLASGMGRAKVTVDGKELGEKPSSYQKGKWWWHTPACWLCRDKSGKHTVEIETLPAEKPGDQVGFRLAVLMVSPPLKTNEKGK